MTKYKPIKNLIEQVKEKGFKNGIKSSLEKDAVETLNRHPKAIPPVLAAGLLVGLMFGKPQPEQMVYVDNLEDDNIDIDGIKYQFRTKGSVPKSQADANGWEY